MRFGKVKGLDKDVSRLVLGTDYMTTERLEDNFAVLDTAKELGYNALDTAHVYGGGDGERVIGRWMESRGNREEVVVLTKGAHHNGDRKRVTPYDIGSDLMDSLARLRTDYVDIYVLHRDDPSLPVGPIVESLNEHHAAGRIRSFGGSNWHHTRIEEGNEYAEKHGLVPFTASSPNYSLAEQVADPWGPGCVTIGGPKEVDARAWYLETGTPIFSYSSLGRGFFSGRLTRSNMGDSENILDGPSLTAYFHDQNIDRLDRVEILAKEKGLSVAQIAMAFLMSQPLYVFPIVGAVNRKEMEENIVAAKTKLSKEELDWLDLLVDER